MNTYLTTAELIDKNGSVEYNGYVIKRAPIYTRLKYEYVHHDYDGPDDNRLGYCMTVDQCIEEIDEKNND